MINIKLSLRINNSNAVSQPWLCLACGFLGSGGFWHVIPLCSKWNLNHYFIKFNKPEFSNWAAPKP